MVYFTHHAKKQIGKTVESNGNCCGIGHLQIGELSQNEANEQHLYQADWFGDHRP
jgi:hypothetical protein